MCNFSSSSLASFLWRALKRHIKEYSLNEFNAFFEEAEIIMEEEDKEHEEEEEEEERRRREKRRRWGKARGRTLIVTILKWETVECVKKRKQQQQLVKENIAVRNVSSSRVR